MFYIINEGQTWAIKDQHTHQTVIKNYETWFGVKPKKLENLNLEEAKNIIKTLKIWVL